MLRPATLLLGCVAWVTTACSIHHHYGRPYAYGVHATDWVMEDQARACAATCRMKEGDAQMLCLSECPGFVTASVATCRDVPEWEVCAMGYEPAARPVPTQRTPTGERVALGTLRVLGAIATAIIEADDDEDDDDDDTGDKTRSERSRKKSKGERDKQKSSFADRVRQGPAHKNVASGKKSSSRK